TKRVSRGGCSIWRAGWVPNSKARKQIMKRLVPIQDLDVKGRRVFVRVDFNVPLRENGGEWEVADGARVEGALPTLRHLMERGARCVLASHLGRPKGKPNPKYSLEPVGRYLSTLLNQDVILTDDCIGDGARGLSHQLRN